jgi:hypothetical protein
MRRLEKARVAARRYHGVTQIPEQLVAEGKDGGRISSGTLTTTLEQVLRSIGEGRHVSLVLSNDVYFAPGVYEKIQQSPQLFTAVMDAITSTPGVQKVFRSEDVRGGASSSDCCARQRSVTFPAGAAI